VAATLILKPIHPSSGVHNSKSYNHISFLFLFILSFHTHSILNSKTCLCCFLLFQSVELVWFLFMFGSLSWFAVLVDLIVFVEVSIGGIITYTCFICLKMGFYVSLAWYLCVLE